MAGIARVGDSITGVAQEHSGHLTPHNNVTISGTITSGSPNVFISGMAVARQGDSTIENDACCGSASGSLGNVSRFVIANGKSIAVVGDPTNPHTGTANISSGCSYVTIW